MRNPLWRLFNQTKTTPRSQPWHGRPAYSSTGAGVAMHPDEALTIPAFWRCVDYISAKVAGAGFWTLERYGLDEAIPLFEHRLTKAMTRKTGGELSPYMFRQTIIANALTWGHGAAEIERDGAGRLAAFHHITPERIYPKRDDGGNVYFQIQNSMGPVTYLAPEEVLWVIGPSFDGISGMNPVAYGARMMGLSVAQEDYASSYFGNGVWPGGVIQHPGRLRRGGKTRIRAAMMSMLQGARRAMGVIVLDEGMEYKPITMPNNTAQLLESRQFSAVDVCRFMGVPPRKVFILSEATKNNEELENVAVVQDTIKPWTDRFAAELKTKCLGAPGSERLEAYFDLTPYMQGTMRDRADAYSTLFGIAGITPNQINAAEGRPRVEGGDQSFVMGNNYVPLDRAGDLLTLQQGGAAQQQQPAAPAEPEETDEQTSEGQRSEQAQARMADQAAIDKVTQHIMERPELAYLRPLWAGMRQERGQSAELDSEMDALRAQLERAVMEKLGDRMA